MRAFPPAIVASIKSQTRRTELNRVSTKLARFAGAAVSVGLLVGVGRLHALERLSLGRASFSQPRGQQALQAITPREHPVWDLRRCPLLQLLHVDPPFGAQQPRVFVGKSSPHKLVQKLMCTQVVRGQGHRSRISTRKTCSLPFDSCRFCFLP